MLWDHNFVALAVRLRLVKLLNQVQILLVAEELVASHFRLDHVQFLEEVLESNELLHADPRIFISQLTGDLLDLPLVLLDEAAGDRG